MGQDTDGECLSWARQWRSTLGPTGTGSSRRGKFQQLVTEGTPVAPLIPKPYYHTNSVQEDLTKYSSPTPGASVPQTPL